MDPPRGTHLGPKGGPVEEERTSGLRGIPSKGDTPEDQGWTLQGGVHVGIRVGSPRGIHLGTKGGPFKGERT